MASHLPSRRPLVFPSWLLRHLLSRCSYCATASQHVASACCLPFASCSPRLVVASLLVAPPLSHISLIAPPPLIDTPAGCCVTSCCTSHAIASCNAPTGCCIASQHATCSLICVSEGGSTMVRHHRLRWRRHCRRMSKGWPIMPRHHLLRCRLHHCHHTSRGRLTMPRHHRHCPPERCCCWHYCASRGVIALLSRVPPLSMLLRKQCCNHWHWGTIVATLLHAMPLILSLADCEDGNEGLTWALGCACWVGVIFELGIFLGVIFKWLFW